MLPKRLEIIDVQGITKDYNFTDKDVVFCVDDKDKVINALAMLFYGDTAAESGEIRLAFFDGERDGKLIRNFATGALVMQLGEDVIITDKGELEDYLFDRISPNKDNFIKSVNYEDDAYLSYVDDPSGYLDDYLSYSDLKAEDFIAERDKVNEKAEKALELAQFVESLKKGNIEELTQKADSIYGKIDGINKKIVLADDEIAESEQTLEDALELEELKKELESARALEEKIKEAENELDNAEELKQKLEVVKKNYELNECNNELKEEIDKLTAQLNDLKEVIEEEEKVKGIKESNYASHSEVAQNIYRELDKLAKDDSYLTDGSEIIKSVEEVYAFNAPLVQKAEEELTILNDSLESTVKKLAQKTVALEKVRADARTKATVRKGLVMEVTLKQKRAFLERIMTNLLESEKRLNGLRNAKAYNDGIKENCKKSLEQAEKDGMTPDNLMAKGVKAVEYMQKLYRASILIENLKKEIEGIDAKIKVNENAVLTYNGDEQALVTAKQTLVEYIAKVLAKQEKLGKSRQELLAKGLELDLYDGTAMGEKCPVCANTVTKKTNHEDLRRVNNAGLDEVNKELELAGKLLNEYNLKLEKVNMRIGELQSRGNTSKVYIESLKEQRKQKLDAITAILADSDSKNSEDIKKKLALAQEQEKKLRDLSGELNIWAENKKLAEENSRKLAEEIKGVENTLNLQQRAQKEYAEDIAVLQAEYEADVKKVLPASANEIAVTVSAFEDKEDRLVEEIKELIAKKDELASSIQDKTLELLALTYHVDSVNIEGRELEYNQVIISKVTKGYNELISRLTKEKADKDQAYDELVKAEESVEMKQKEFDDLARTIDKLLTEVESNKKVIEALNENVGLDVEQIKEVNGAELQKDIMDEEKYDALQREVEDYYATVNSLRLRIEEGDESLTDPTAIKNGLDMRFMEKEKLKEELAKAKQELITQLGMLAVEKMLVNKADNLRQQADGYKAEGEGLGAIAEKNDPLIAELISDVLQVITNGHYSLDTTKEKYVLFDAINDRAVNRPSKLELLLAGMGIRTTLDDICAKLTDRVYTKLATINKDEIDADTLYLLQDEEVTKDTIIMVVE